MADVSVRFQVAGDSEVVLNLSMPQAIRLMEAIARKVGDAMGSAGRPAVAASWPDAPAAGSGERHSPS